MTHALRILFGWFSRDRRKARAEAHARERLDRCAQSRILHHQRGALAGQEDAAADRSAFTFIRHPDGPDIRIGVQRRIKLFEQRIRQIADDGDACPLKPLDNRVYRALFHSNVSPVMVCGGLFVLGVIAIFSME